MQNGVASVQSVGQIRAGLTTRISEEAIPTEDMSITNFFLYFIVFIYK